MTIERISLTEQLNRLKSGYPAHPEFVACSIRAMAKISIGDYLHAFPDKLERLQEILELTSEEAAYMPYSKIAKRIEQLWHVRRNRALLGEALDALAAPIRKCYMERRSAYANSRHLT